MRRVISIILAVGIAGGLLYLLRAQIGSAVRRVGWSTQVTVEDWCATQLRAIAGDLLRPELRFASLRYEYPATAVLTDIRLIDEGVEALTASSIRIGFREVPRTGQPLVIESVELLDPVVHLEPNASGSFYGFSNIVKSTEGNLREDGGSTRPSDVFVIRMLNIRHGELRYVADTGRLMRIEGLEFDLNGAPDDAGWYAMKFKLDRESVFSLDVDLRLNIDSAELDIASLELRSRLAAGDQRLLPALQEMVDRYQLRGESVLTLNGFVPLGDPLRSDVAFTFDLADAHARFGTFDLPVSRGHCEGRLRQGLLAVNPIELHAFDGTATGSFHWPLDPPDGARLHAVGRELALESAFPPAEGVKAKYSGRVRFDLDVTGRPGDLRETIAGGGPLEVDRARLIGMPILGGLFRLIGEPANAARSGTDHGSARVAFFGDRVTFSSIEAVGTTTAAKGDGSIFYGSLIDFLFNCGPIEKLNRKLGPVGELIGKVTDRVVRYEVTGTISEPKYAVRPLGIGTKRDRGG